MNHKLKIFRHKLRSDFAQPLLPALVVFSAFAIICLFISKTAKNDILAQRNVTVNTNAAFIESGIRQRFSVYEDTLRSANGLFLSSESVNRDEWKTFVDSLELPARFPGARGVGYVRLVRNQDREDFISSIQNEGLSNYTIYPNISRDVYAPVMYIVPTAGQPDNDRTSPALGFDMYSDPVRKDAMVAASMSGQPTLSGLASLKLSNTGTFNGFILFIPYYIKNAPISTATQRQEALYGYFYMPFSPESIFSSLYRQVDKNFAFSITDNTASKSEDVYSSNNNVDDKKFTLVKTSTVEFYGRKWKVRYYADDGIVPYSLRSRPLAIKTGGLIFAAILATVIYLLIQRRTRALKYNDEKKLDDAKDELLSLASHQLRTPATAVKQYISMVSDGFAGDVTLEQQKLLQMAYDSNERQLRIVDDLLYVARVDAGKAALNLETVTISALIKSVISDVTPALNSRNQKVIYDESEHEIITEVDQQYLRMIFENLLSNASKYSHENTQISIKMQKVDDYIKVSFTDNGVGIDNKDLNNIFLKFTRIPNELSRHIGGSGIGLYLAKQLAILHGGDIMVESKLGQGSTFTVALPIKN